MVMSVNTNVGAMVALQNLALTNKQLINTQLRVTTGLRVNGPKDDAATFAIAQNMRGDIAGYGSVAVSLAMGESVVNVGIDAGTSIADLLVQMKGKAVQASQEGMDQNSYNALHLEFTALREQLTTIVNTAAFNGKNLITSGATLGLYAALGAVLDPEDEELTPTMKLKRGAIEDQYAAQLDGWYAAGDKVVWED